MTKAYRKETPNSCGGKQICTIYDHDGRGVWLSEQTDEHGRVFSRTVERVEAMGWNSAKEFAKVKGYARIK